MESFVYIFSLSPFSSLLREAVIMPIFQVENMRLRTVKGFAWGHTVDKISRRKSFLLGEASSKMGGTWRGALPGHSAQRKPSKDYPISESTDHWLCTILMPGFTSFNNVKPTVSLWSGQYNRHFIDGRSKTQRCWELATITHLREWFAFRSLTPKPLLETSVCSVRDTPKTLWRLESQQNTIGTRLSCQAEHCMGITIFRKIGA